MSMKTIMRGLVVACCAALGLNAWAGWTGTLSNTTPTKVLDGTSLADLDNMTFSGVIGGGWMGGDKVFEHFFLEDIVTPEEGDAYRFCQMEINDYVRADNCHLKFVTVKFTLGEDGIYAVQSDQGYVHNKGPELIGQKIDRSSTDYTVSDISYPNYVLKSLDVVTEIQINDGETMTLTAENKPGADAIVYVNAGGTLDLHGVGDTEFTLILNGGTLKNTGNGLSNGTKSLAQGIIVRADSTIDCGSNIGTIAGGHALHNINLGNHTLTKTGANTLFLSNVEFIGSGTIKIEKGTVRIYNSSGNQYPDNDHPGHSIAAGGLVVDVQIASGAKLECYGAPKFHSITGVSDDSKGELHLFGATGLEGIPGCYGVSKLVLGGNKSTGYIGWNESAVELTINSTFEITQGSSSSAGTIKTLKGTGSITKTWSNTPIIYVEDHSGFTGTVAEDIGVHLSIAKSETAYYYTIAQVKEAIATTEVTNISISEADLKANGLQIVEGKIVAIPDAPTATIEPITVEGLHAAYKFTTNEEEATEYYADWNADFVVSFDRDVAADTIILAGQSDHHSADWVELPLTSAVTARDKFGLIAMVGAQLGLDGLKVPYSMVCDTVKVFQCGVKNLSTDNEGTKMTVSLVLSKDGEDDIIVNTTEYTINETAPQGPTSWGETTPSEVIELPEGATTTVTAAEIAAWAAKNNVAFSTTTTIPVNALIFNVAPDAVPEDPEAAAAEILKDLAVDVESLIKNGLSEEALAQLAEDYPMATFELVAVETLPDTDNAKFRQLKVSLK